MVYRYQYWVRSWKTWVPTPYPSSIDKARPYSSASYTLWIYTNIPYRTSFCTPSIFWTGLAPKLAIPIHIYALNLFKISFKSLEYDNHRSMFIMTTFQSISTRPMMWYYPLPSGIRMMVPHMQYVSKHFVPNNSCIISTTIHHLRESRFPPACSTASQIFK